MITEMHQEGRFYRLSTSRAAHYKNIKPHNPSTEDWCIPADMEEGNPNIMILIGTNNVLRGSDEEEAQGESMNVCLFTTLWQKFK